MFPPKRKGSVYIVWQNENMYYIYSTTNYVYSQFFAIIIKGSELNSALTPVSSPIIDLARALIFPYSLLGVWQIVALWNFPYVTTIDPIKVFLISIKELVLFQIYSFPIYLDNNKVSNTLQFMLFCFCNCFADKFPKKNESFNFQYIAVFPIMLPVSIYYSHSRLAPRCVTRALSPSARQLVRGAFRDATVRWPRINLVIYTNADGRKIQYKDIANQSIKVYMVSDVQYY